MIRCGNPDKCELTLRMDGPNPRLFVSLTTLTRDGTSGFLGELEHIGVGPALTASLQS